MIKVNTTFGGWKEVNKEQAKEWVEFKMKNTHTIRSVDKKEYIQRKITGITIDELLGEEE